MQIDADLERSRKWYFRAAAEVEAALDHSYANPNSRAAGRRLGDAYADKRQAGRELVLVAMLAGVVPPDVVSSIHYPSEMDQVLYELTR